MPRVTAPSDIESCDLTYSKLQELWLGSAPSGSCFDSREALVEAWRRGRSVVMRLWARGGRRPQGFYEFEFDGPRPPYALERSTLWRRADVLSTDERAELERTWKAEFDVARGMGAKERRAHLEHCDVPHELITLWAPSRRRPRRHLTPAEEAAPEEVAAK